MVTEKGKREGERKQGRRREREGEMEGGKKEERERECLHTCTLYIFNHVGRLNIGDQVLVCDGVSLIDVTHDEAGLAFKQAMDSQSVSGNSKISATNYFVCFYFTCRAPLS